MSLLDILFSEWKPYRKWRGGVWRQVAPWPAYVEIDPFWTRGAVLSCERVLDVERYQP